MNLPPLGIYWSRKARGNLRDIRDFVPLDKPDAAARLAVRIVSVAEVLRLHPRLGRPSAEPGTRELVIGGTPYVVFYRADKQRITILKVLHGARQRNTER